MEQRRSPTDLKPLSPDWSAAIREHKSQSDFLSARRTELIARLSDMESSKLTAADDVEGTKQTQILETEDEKKTRLLSLKIIYFTMFLMTLGFSIILTGIWPYLDKVSWRKKARNEIQLTNLLPARPRRGQDIHGIYRRR